MDGDGRDSVYDTEFHTVSERDVGAELQAVYSPEERRGFVERVSKNLRNHESFSGWGIDGDYGHPDGEIVRGQAVWSPAIRQAGQPERQVSCDRRTGCEIWAEVQSCFEPHRQYRFRGHGRGPGPVQPNALQDFHSGKAAILFGKRGRFQF